MLPLGTIVKLKEGKLKLMIVNRGVGVGIDGENCYFEYAGSVYPIGLEQENLYYFNQNNIESVIFKGYVDEEEIKFEKDYKEWKIKNNIRFTDVEKFIEQQKTRKFKAEKIESKLFNNK